jgi:tetratricopeptide (TPR) repeat protein
MGGAQESMAQITAEKIKARGANLAAFALSICCLIGASPGQVAGQTQNQNAGAQNAKPVVNAAPAGQQTPPAQAVSPAPKINPKINPKEDAAYKAFYDVPPAQTDELIRQGEAFLSNYPASAYRELVYSRLAQAYVVKQNFGMMETDGEKALALNPNDVDALALLGWAIPHNFDPADPSAAARLQEAENYSRRALQILATLQVPAPMSAEQFAQLKNDRLSQAHSGLGLVYFRRGQYAQAAPEFQQAVKLASSSDPIDFFLLGQSLQQLQEFSDAAVAYDQCGKIPGTFQLRCQANALQARHQAAAQPASAPPQSAAHPATASRAAVKP